MRPREVLVWRPKVPRVVRLELRLLLARLLRLPALPELLSPLLTVVPVQILAYHMAVLRGINPDLFRRDDPRYAAALGLLKL